MLKTLQIKNYYIIFAEFFGSSILLQRNWLAHGSLKPKDRVRISGGVLNMLIWKIEKQKKLGKII